MEKHKKYNPTEVESYWQKIWEERRIYQPNLDTAKRPFYNLMMFPYPSAEGMHVGNMYAFTGADIYGRFKRMQGNDVFEPIGLDGFGIHSENYAIKVSRHPKEQAKISEENFYRQLRATGNAFDWSRTVETYNPRYYKWTQWIFVQLFKKGLAYRKKAAVNFCPKDKTVLADEQVIDGKCERCGSIVEKRDLEQWFFKITDYADRLLAGLDKIDWTEKVKIAQRNWIGKSEGVLLEFKIKGSHHKVEVFTTALDTVFGVTFLVIAPEHPLVSNLLGQGREVMNYLSQALAKTRKKATEEGKVKTGVSTNYYAINPFTNQEIPIWIADYVLMQYGTGAVMGVPGHDARDHEFALKYKLPIKPVIEPTKEAINPKLGKDGFWDYPEIKTQFADKSILFNSGNYNGLTSRDGKRKMVEFIEAEHVGKRKVTYHLRDWLISRQRYWGPPIPMIYCEKCNWQPVPDKDLPVLLPEVKDWKPKGTGESPLASVESFVNTTCPNCAGKARRETDVSDTFLDSSWYFFRYVSTEFDDKPWDQKRAKKWLPVDMYIGGAEHSVLHLLYTRFLTMVFHDLKLTDFDEPFPRFFAHGLLIKEGAKMSKSKGNVVVPDEYIKKYGADTLRTYLMFLGPFSQGGDFYDSSIGGVYRFLQRVYNFASNVILSESEGSQSQKARKEDSSASPQNDNGTEVEVKVHETIKKVTTEMEALRFNTSVAALMELLNSFQQYQSSVKKEHLEQFLLMLAPFAPHLTEELWQHLHGSDTIQTIHKQLWPAYDPKMLEKEEVTIVVQVNGKVRDELRIKNNELRMKKEIEELARKRQKIQKHLEGKSVQKVIYVEGKIINFVVG